MVSELWRNRQLEPPEEAENPSSDIWKLTPVPLGQRGSVTETFYD